MQVLNDLRKKFITQLSSLYDASEAESVFFLVMEDVFHYSRKDFLLQKTFPFGATENDKIEDILRRLLTGEPIQYIIGSTRFMGIHLLVNKRVLIPRPETEELVDCVVQDYKADAIEELRLMDVGTGSGCIPIALKKHIPQAYVFAMDVSNEALEVAKHNALINNVSINFLLADILEWDIIFSDDIQFDIIVSNPPYIPPGEKDLMHPNVLQFEPHLALFVEEKAPLLFYETIAAFALKHLRPQGKLYFEINRHYGEEVKNLLQKKGFREVYLLQDLHGADRMIKALL